MKYNPAIHHRRSIRLKGYDYTWAGVYFITICTQDRACLFGEIVAGEMRLNEVGRIIGEKWRWLENQYDYVEISMKSGKRPARKCGNVIFMNM